MKFLPRLLASLVRIFFFNDTATTEIYTLSLHDALPISTSRSTSARWRRDGSSTSGDSTRDRKSTRLNSSHVKISYAVLCLKKKTTTALETSVTNTPGVSYYFKEQTASS